MKIVIVGAGTVGKQLVDRLSRENHDIIVVDHFNQLREIEDAYDIAVVAGNASSIDVLRRAGVGSADLVVAVTNSDANNVLICQIAHRLGAKYTSARLRNSGIFAEPDVMSPLDLGIDMVIYPEKMAAQQIRRLIQRPFAHQYFRFLENQVEVLELSLTRDHRMDGLDIEGIRKRSSRPFLIVTILRKGQAFVPVNRKDVFHAGDKIYLAVEKCNAEKVVKDLGFEVFKVERLFIYGGTNIGMSIARELENEKIKLSIIESSRLRTKEMAYELINALVLHGEGTDKNLLESEGVDMADYFVSVTDDENSNILACLLAKKLGARRNLSLVTNPDYVQLENQLNIDTVVSQRLITINKVMRYVRQGNVIGLNEIVEGQIQAIEYRVTGSCALINKPFKTLAFRKSFPDKVIIGGIHRDGVAFIPDGETEFLPEDGVLLFSEMDMVHELEHLFPIS